MDEFKDYEKANKTRLLRMFNKPIPKGETGYILSKLRQYVSTFGTDDSLKDTKLVKNNSKAKSIVQKGTGKAAAARTPIGGGGGGGGGFSVQEKIRSLKDPVKRTRNFPMNKGGMIKKYAYGGRVAKSSAEKS